MQMQFPESYAKIAKRLWYMSFSNNLFEGNLAPLRVRQPIRAYDGRSSYHLLNQDQC